MKSLKEQRLTLWLEAEKRLTTSLNPEDLRTSGLLAAEREQWTSALLRLEEAVYHGVRDFQTLDALGEAVYQAKAYQALLAYKDLYRDPLIAAHMARAMLMCNQTVEAREFLAISRPSLLQKALKALMGVTGTIEQAMQSMLEPLQDPEIEKLSFPEYWQALMAIAETAGRKDAVRLAERRAKAVAYDRPVIHFNQSLRLLAEGELRAGWLLYDWRLSPGSPTMSETQCADLSLWEGEELKDQRLLVVLDCGWGDQIFSLRFVDELLKNGARLELAVDEPLQELMKSSFPNLKLHPKENVHDPAYWAKLGAEQTPEYWCFSLSLPARADISRVVGQNGYLQAPQELVDSTRLKLKEMNPNHLPVRGLVWHGDIRTKPMRTRAYSLEEFLQESKILESPCLLVCLQKDVTASELAILQTQAEKAGSKLFNAAPTLDNFAVTAAWMSCLDRMWSCDTATAHLAGALNLPSTVLIRNTSIWQWRKIENGRSFWYDSIQLQDALVPKYSYMYDLREA